MADGKPKLIPISMIPPERSYASQLLRDATGVARFLGEVIVIDSLFVAGYAGQSIAPALLAGVRRVGETIANPSFHRWLLVWAAFLFFTCY